MEFDVIWQERERVIERQDALRLVRARGAALLGLAALGRKRPSAEARRALEKARAATGTVDRAWHYEYASGMLHAQLSGRDESEKWAADLAIKPWIARCDERLARFAADRRWLDVRLARAAKARALVPGEARYTLRTVYRSTYSTQGLGADRYARQAAEQYAEERRSCLTDEERAAGIEVLVEAGETVRAEYQGQAPASYPVVLVGVANRLDAEALERREDRRTLSDWLADCWKRGVNPRVYNPWLPHGLEQRLGVGFDGSRRAV